MQNPVTLEETLNILQILVESIQINPEDLKQYYDLNRYMHHDETCSRPRGDQACECGMSSVRFNFETLLDECTGYHGQAPIDRAKEILKRAKETK